MDAYKPVPISYILEGIVYDFNLVGVPFEVITPLLNALRYELTNRIALLTQASFANERLVQHDRHLKSCKANGTYPVQQFIDFPVPENF